MRYSEEIIARGRAAGMMRGQSNTSQRAEFARQDAHLGRGCRFLG
jgi:hypothetical protein